MDEPTTHAPPAPRTTLVCLLVLILLACGLRAWQISHTEVATRDSIGFTRTAYRLGHEPWSFVIRTSSQHPGYSVLIHLASYPVRAAIPDNLPRAMQLSAQIVSCLAGVLLVVPMFFLGLELFGRGVAFWATLLFQVLPTSGRLLPDGLSEPVFLLLAATSLFAACRALRTEKVGWFILAGLTSALAYLTRTEGLLIAAVAGFVLLGLQLSKRWRRDWVSVGRNGLALTVATFAVAAPFMWLIGGVTLKPSASYMINPDSWKMAPAEKPAAAVVHAPLPLAMWNFGPHVKPQDRYGWAAYALVAMVDKGFFHALTLPFLAGLWLLGRRTRQTPAAWIPLVLMAILAALVYRLGQSNGYLGERHVLLINVCGLYAAVAALGVFATFLAGRLAPFPRVWAVAMLLLLTLVPLPKTLATLHGERKGFRLAGEWLAANSDPEDLVLDPFAWSSFYAGRQFQLGKPQPPDFEKWLAERQKSGKAASTCYVVLDESKSKHEHLWYLINPAREQAQKGTEVKRFRTRRGSVVIYRVQIGNETRVGMGKGR